MTLEKREEWLAKAELVFRMRDYDQCGNDLGWQIYKYAGELFLVQVVNNLPRTDPERVTLKKRMVEQAYYETESGAEYPFTHFD